MIMTVLLCFAYGSHVHAEENDGNWSCYQNSETNNGVTSRPGPTDAAHATSKWTVQLEGHNTPPIIVGDYIYTASADYLYRLDKKTGKVLKKVEMEDYAGYALNPVVYAQGKIYVIISKNGTAIEAFREDDLTHLWTSDGQLGEFASPLTYHEITEGETTKGYLYTGTWSSTRQGIYFCVSAETGTVLWTRKTNGEGQVNGFWWDGAYATDTYVAFASENGISPESDADGAVLYTVNATTGEKIDTFNLKGSVRNTVVYNEGYLYVGTRAGRLYRIAVDNYGNLAGADNNNYSYVDLGGPIRASVVINKTEKRLYVGVEQGTNSAARFIVLDCSMPFSNGMSYLSSVNVSGDPKGAPVLSTAESGKDYIYFTCNEKTGALYSFTYTKSGGCSAAQTLFTSEASQQQYCISHLAVDTDGTIYYTNDSRNMFAIAPKVIENITVKENGVSWVDEAFHAGTCEYNLLAGTNVNTVTFNVNKITGDNDVTVEYSVNGESQNNGTVSLNGETTNVEIKVTRKAISVTYLFHIGKVTEDNTSLGILYYGKDHNYPGLYPNQLGDIVGTKTDYTVDLTKVTESTNHIYSLWVQPLNTTAEMSVYAVENVKSKTTGKTYAAGAVIDDWSWEQDDSLKYSMAPADYSKNMQIRISVVAKGKTQDYFITFDRGNDGKVEPTKPATGTSATTATKPATTATTTTQVTVAKPKKVTGVKAKKKKNKLTITWKKVSKVSGYQILIAKDKKFKKSKKTVTITKGSVTKKSVKYLKKMKYVKIRAFNKGNGTTVYGAYSKVIKVK